MVQLFLQLFVVLGSLLGSPPTYKTYHNARFGFSIDYPTTLRPQPEADNADGRRFVSADGQTSLTAYAGYDVLDGGLAQYQQLSRRHWQGKKATLVLDQKLATGFVLSGTLGPDIFYEKAVLQAGTLTTFVWQYPATRKREMDAVIRHTISTLQPGE
ncbi:hypothetical protein [Hymenobacter chitinivorans]|uniref:Uncharacterized protein n=1 Tax=Hymenobacter chitinivorans DSM 11115 TaxID=1121954 RepID=A0A2M9BSZ0_9BACT|nr:hypothetical protein [Hymenobacter chitinivorans]PJJ61068.1 hypothetical protein CLV45_2506 [Hymenobacter chitinivorans DSM 11115]